MTFVPNASSRMGVSPVARIVLFWLLMIILAVVLWRMASSKKSGGTVESITYSDFMQQVDLKNVASVKLIASQSTAEIQGEFRQPAQKFKVTIPKEVISNLTERLRNEGVSIEVGEIKNATWAELLTNLAPFILLLAFWVFMIRQMRAKRNPPPPDNLLNRPIG